MGAASKVSNKSNKTESNTSKRIAVAVSADLFFVVLLSVFLIVIPFYRGLYFRENYMPSIAAVSGIFVFYFLYRLYKSKSVLISSYMDIALILLPFFYLLSFAITSVNAKDAFDAVLRYFAYFILYKMVADYVKNEKYRSIIENTVFASIFLVGFTGILNALGYMKLSGVMINGRLFGLYQYTNATAAVLGAGLLVGMGLLINTRRIIPGIIYFLGLSTVLSALMLTISRGAIAVYGALFVLALLVLPIRFKNDVIINMTFLAATSGLFVLMFFRKSNHLILYYLAVLALAAALQYVYRRLFRERLSSLSKRASVIILVAILVLAALFIIAAFSTKTTVVRIEDKANVTYKFDNLAANAKYKVVFDASSETDSESGYGVIITSKNLDGTATELKREFGACGTAANEKQVDFTTPEKIKTLMVSFYNRDKGNYKVYNKIRIADDHGRTVQALKEFRFIPSAIAKRFENISLSSNNNDARLIFTKDALKIFGQYPVLGAGGGAWQNLYLKYQSYSYYTKEAHNFYIQLLTETGVVGMSAIVAVLLILLLGFFKTIREGNNPKGIFVYLAAFMLLGHAAMDFDLSLSAAAYLLWAIIGLCSYYYSGFKPINAKYFKYTSYVLAVIASVLIITSVSIYAGMKDGDAAADLLKSDPAKAGQLYSKAIKLDKYNSAYRLDYMQLMLKQGREAKRRPDIGAIKGMLDDVSKYEPYNNKYQSVMASVIVSIGDFQRAADYADRLVSEQPLDMQAYAIKMQVNYEIAKYLGSISKDAEAVPYIDNMLEIKDQVEAAKKISIKPLIVPDNLAKMDKLAQNWKQFSEIKDSDGKNK